MNLPRRSLIVAALAILVLIAFATHRYLNALDPHAREVQAIQGRMLELAETLCFADSESALGRLGYPERLVGYFADPVELDITIGARHRSGSMSRGHLREGLAGMRASNRGLKVKFLDVVVDLPPASPDAPEPARTAKVHLTSTIYFAGDPDYWVQEFRAQMVKTNSTWLVRRVETVETMVK